MRWSILIASHHTRHEHLTRLLDSLAPQLTPDVEVVLLWNKGNKRVGYYRTELLEEAAGTYISHVDDDDRLPDYHVAEILTALEEEPDQVGFIVEFNDIDGHVLKPGSYLAYHSLKHGRWYQKNKTFYRDVSHLNPIRRDLAVLGEYVGHRAEDVTWADTVRGHVKTEVFIPKILYHYDYRRPDPGKPGPLPDLPDGVRLHPASEV